MAAPMARGPSHHQRLTVSEVNRRREFDTSLPSFGIGILKVRNPDNIQLELTAAVR